MKGLKITDFLSLICKIYLEDCKNQAVLMKFEFGREKTVEKINFLAIKGPDSEFVYGWSEIYYYSSDNPKIYYCCNAPLKSQESYDYISNIILFEINNQFDFFPSPSAIIGFKELEYKIASLGEGCLAIKLFN